MSVRRRLQLAACSQHWGSRLMVLVGSEWCGDYRPPEPRNLYVRWRGNGREQRLEQRREYPDCARRSSSDWTVFSAGNDGSELWIGGTHEWRWHTTQPEALRLARFIVWDWWVIAQWCGLRRWMYYRGLHAQVEAWNRADLR